MKLKGLFIDLDGTLADSIEPLKKVFFHFLDLNGIARSENAFKFLMGFTLPEIILLLKEKYQLTPSLTELKNLYEKLILEAYSSEVKVMPGAVEVLYECTQINRKLVLVTAASEKVAHLFLQNNKLASLFNLLICAREGEPGKPNPAIYLRALKSSHINASNAIVLEDSENGVRAGLGAGCKVLWLNSNATFSSNVVNVRNWTEIREWIEMNES